MASQASEFTQWIIHGVKVTDQFLNRKPGMEMNFFVHLPLWLVSWSSLLLDTVITVACVFLFILFIPLFFLDWAGFDLHYLEWL